MKQFVMIVKREQQALKALESKANDQEAQVQAAKAKARAAKLSYKKLRKQAKRAKALLLELREEVRQQHWILARVEKRLAKAQKRSATKASAGRPGPVEGAAASTPRAKSKRPPRRLKAGGRAAAAGIAPAAAAPKVGI